MTDTANTSNVVAFPALRMPEKGFRSLFRCVAGVQYHLTLGKVTGEENGVAYRELVFTGIPGGRTTIRIWGDRSTIMKGGDLVCRAEIFVSVDNCDLTIHLDVVEAPALCEFYIRKGAGHKGSRGWIQSKLFPGNSRSYEIIDLKRAAPVELAEPVSLAA